MFAIVTKYVPIRTPLTNHKVVYLPLRLNPENVTYSVRFLAFDSSHSKVSHFICESFPPVRMVMIDRISEEPSMWGTYTSVPDFRLPCEQ